MKAKYIKYLDISTGHISKKDNTILLYGDHELICDPYEFGFRVYISKGTKVDYKEYLDRIKNDKFSKSFIKIIKWAKKKGMDWVEFDRDGHTYKKFKVFNW